MLGDLFLYLFWGYWRILFIVFVFILKFNGKNFFLDLVSVIVLFFMKNFVLILWFVNYVIEFVFVSFFVFFVEGLELNFRIYNYKIVK